MHKTAVESCTSRTWQEKVSLGVCCFSQLLRSCSIRLSAIFIRLGWSGPAEIVLDCLCASVCVVSSCFLWFLRHCYRTLTPDIILTISSTPVGRLAPAPLQICISLLSPGLWPRTLTMRL